MDAGARRWMIFCVVVAAVVSVVAIVAPYYALHREGSPYRKAMEEAARAREPVPPPRALTETTAQLRTFVDHTRAGRFEDAYALMTRAYRDSVPLARFRTAVAASAYLTKADDVTVFRVREMAGTRQADGVLATRAGSVVLAAFEAREEGGWALTGLQLGGTPALPGP